ncbi:MAG: hypothetical protein M1379_17620 [Firmicutes bacterium]|nr:hypothetical protein [Bacillota bacterium]
MNGKFYGSWDNVQSDLIFALSAFELDDGDGVFRGELLNVGAKFFADFTK